MTIEPITTLKHVFTNLSAFEIIDVEHIINDIGLDISKERNAFIVSTEISELIKSYSKSKRIQGIIYINKNLNEHIINTLKDMVLEYDKSLVDEVILMDNYDIPRIERLYPCVDEVLYFTTFKKVKIIECKNLFDLNQPLTF